MKKLDNLLIQVKEIFDRWGVPPSKWCVSVAAAMEVWGYKVEHPVDDIDIHIVRRYVPWKVPANNFRTIPPPHSKYAQDLQKFHNHTGYPIDIAVAPFAAYSTRIMLAGIRPYRLPDGQVISVQTPEAECEMRLSLLRDMKWFEKWGVESIKQWLTYEREVLKYALRKKDKKVQKIAKAVLARLQEHKRYWQDWEHRESLHGLAAYPGRIKGTVRVANSLSEVKKLKRSEVLVTVRISQRWLPYIIRARAIVTSGGGVIGHVGIIAREYKIPTIMNCNFANSILKTGDKILVDSYKGIVKKLGSQGATSLE